MSKIFMLTHKQLNRIKPYFPLSHGKPRVDDRAGDQRDHVRHQERPAMEGCTKLRLLELCATI
jgi:hypothetical protein